MENMEQLKQQGRDPRDFCGDNGRESFLGFGAKVMEPILAKNELLLNLKIKLTCNSAGEWKVAWAGLDEKGPCTNPRWPPPVGPMPKLKQVWKPVGLRPSRPVAQKHNLGPQIPKPTKPVTQPPQVNGPSTEIAPEISTSNRFSIFEFGSSSTFETHPSTIPSGLSQGSAASAVPEPAVAIPSFNSPTMELSTSEASSRQGLDGAATPTAESFFISLATQELRPGGIVVHA
jgi:hypothetical protein